MVQPAQPRGDKWKQAWRRLHSPLVLPAAVGTAAVTAVADLPMRVTEAGWIAGLAIGGLVLLGAIIALLDMLPLGLCWLIGLVRFLAALMLGLLPVLEKARAQLAHIADIGSKTTGDGPKDSV